MDAPSSFVEQLERVFNGRLRIRWSAKNQEFHIEQKVGRGFALAPVAIDEGRDDLICARDGYFHVMAIKAGDRMPCPSCNYKLTVPVMDTADMKCPYCALMGRTTRVVAGYWPLNERLIEHLRKIDPLRGAQQELAEEADRYNRALIKSAENTYSDVVTSKASDDYNRLVGIPQVGFTGREHAWDHA